MNQKILIPLGVIFSLFLQASVSMAGHEVGNGGNVVWCGTSAPVTLDFLLTKGLYGGRVKPVRVANAAASLRRILRLLSEKAPHLSGSFENFANEIGNADPNRSRVWRASSHELELVGDEDIGDLPWMCARHSFVFKQAAIRLREQHSGSWVTVYEYDSEVLGALSQLQLSFLYVHEWLWEVSSDVVTNRKINYFLHSTLFAQMTASQAKRELKKYGLGGR